MESRGESAPLPGAGAVESTLDTNGERVEEGLDLEERGLPLERAPDLRRAEVLGEVDRGLVALCRERGPLRAVLARIALRLVSLRVWERLSYARLSDYAVECLGLSGRSVRSLAEVGARFGALPRLEQALVSGTLGWTKVRLLARLPRREDEGAWIAYARRVTAEELSRAVRAVDRGSIEAGALDETSARSGLFEVRCTPEVRWKWTVARGAARRAAGRVLHVSEAAELIAAEVLSALPINEEAEEGVCEEAGTSWSRVTEPALACEGSVSGEDATMGRKTQTTRTAGTAHTAHTAHTAGTAHTALRFPSQGDEAGLVRLTGGEASAAHTALRPPWRADEEQTAADPPRRSGGARPAPRSPTGAPQGVVPLDEGDRFRLVGGAPGSRGRSGGAEPAEVPHPSFPPVLESLLEGLEEADVFELEERFRRALSMEQRLEARIGPLLALVWGRFVHRALGYASREAYAREHLGMDPTRARALVRLERAAVQSEAFTRVYRTGALSWVKAGVLAPLVSADPLGWFVEDWVTWAGRVTVRRLGEDVERALALAETAPVAFRQSGGLPAEARGDREIGATPRGTGADGAGPLASSRPTVDDREIGATPKGTGADEAGPLASSRPTVDDREIGATPRGTGADEAGPLASSRPTVDDREIGATPKGTGADGADPWYHPKPNPLKSAPDEVCWARFIGPPDVVQLFRAVLCTVRRRMEREAGRLPTAGEALGVMLDHVLSTWGELDDKLAARHKVFARDGWRCAVPGCTSMQNLHDHHIRFRSAGGGNAPENRITLCAFHHLRGVHAGLLRCVGRAPDGLRWEMGIRPGVSPRMAYRSGDIQVPAAAP